MKTAKPILPQDAPELGPTPQESGFGFRRASEAFNGVLNTFKAMRFWDAVSLKTHFGGVQ